MYKTAVISSLILCFTLSGAASANENKVNIKTMYQDPVTNEIHSDDGRLFKNFGQYESRDSYGNTIYKDCALSDFYGDPSISPPEDAELPGIECELREINGEAVIKRVVSDSDSSSNRPCDRISGSILGVVANNLSL